MDIHKEFVNQIVIKRKAALRDLITGEDSLNLKSLKPDTESLINSLDRIFYTIDFLEKNNLIKCIHHSNNYVVTLFDGFSFDKEIEKGLSQVYALHFLQSKLSEDGAYSWSIEMLPGLMSFVKNKYRTDEQVKDRKNTYFAVVIAIVSASLTAVFTSLMTQAPIINFSSLC